MVYIDKIIFLLLLVLLGSCNQNSETVKVQRKRNNITNLRDKVKEIEIDDVIISNNARVYIFKEYLIIKDYLSNDKVFHLFDKNNYNHITSFGDRGQGPYEITAPGDIGMNEVEHTIYVSDYGKLLIYSFNIDSVLINHHYKPIVRQKMEAEIFPGNYLYINDTLSIASFILPIGDSNFKPSVGKWNMSTGEITLLDAHDHPKIERKRTSFTVSLEHGIFIECYWHHNLMTICDLNGNLKYYIYGPKWDTTRQNRINFYRDVVICNNNIVALYADGENNFLYDKTGAIIGGNHPTKLIIFSINGDYIHTLETGYKITNFCYDKDKNRIIMVLDDLIQFAFLDMDDII